MSTFLDLLTSPVLGQTAWRWLASIATAALFLMVVVFVRYRVAKPAVQQGIIGDIEAAIVNLRRLPMAVISVYLGSLCLELSSPAKNFFFGLFVVAAGVQVGVSAMVVARRWIQRYLLQRADDDATEASIGVLGTVAEFIIWTLIGLMVLSNLGVNVSGLVASLGVGGIAIALAAQNVLGDLFASLSIVFDKPFETGDFIKVGNELGVVRKVGLKTTRVAALQGEELIFSNTDLLNSRIQNFKKMRERRVVLEFGLLYSTSLDALKAVPEIVRDVVNDTPGTRFDRAHFRNFGESSLMFEAVYYVDTNDYTTYMDRQQTINFGLLEQLRDRELVIAFPTRTIHLNSPLTAV